MIQKPRQWGGLGLSWAVAPKKNITAEGSGCGLIDILFLYLPGGTEEITETCSKDVQILQLRFDWGLPILTYSMVQSPSWEANWFAASQEIPRILWNPKVHYRTHKRPPPVPILGQPNPVHIPTSHLLEIHPNITHPSKPRSPQWSLSLRFPHQDPIHPPLLTHTRHIPSPTSGLFCLQRKHPACKYFLTWMFYREGLLAPRLTPKLEDHPLSAVHDCLFNLFAATLHIGGRSSTRNLRTRHAMLTGTHYTWNNNNNNNNNNV